MRRILITGASRGLGLEMTRLYAARSETLVFAACRAPDRAAALTALCREHPDRVVAVSLDVVEADSVESAVRSVRERADGLDVLLNNAGVYPGSVSAPVKATRELGSLRADAMLEVFRVNTVAPVVVAQACIGLLRRGREPRIVNVSSDAGSLENCTGGGAYSYAASKAALNMMTRCLAADLRSDGMVVASVHPGFVRTDMGGPEAPLDPEDTLPSLLRVIDALSLEDSGGFRNWDGAVIPW